MTFLTLAFNICSNGGALGTENRFSSVSRILREGIPVWSSQVILLVNLFDQMFQFMIRETSHPKENRMCLKCEEQLHPSLIQHYVKIVEPLTGRTRPAFDNNRLPRLFPFIKIGPYCTIRVPVLKYVTFSQFNSCWGISFGPLCLGESAVSVLNPWRMKNILHRRNKRRKRDNHTTCWSSPTEKTKLVEHNLLVVLDELLIFVPKPVH